MKIIRFKSRSHEEDTLHKLKKMKMFLEELEECIENEEDDVEFRGPRYRDDYDYDERRMDSRYGYRRGRM